MSLAALSFQRSVVLPVTTERSDSMSTEARTETSPTQRRQELIEKYWAGDMARKVYLLRRQRKSILEHCRRIAVIGASTDPDSESYGAMEKLLGLGLEVIPVF